MIFTQFSLKILTRLSFSIRFSLPFVLLLLFHSDTLGIEITSVNTTKESFSPVRNQVVNINYELDTNADISLNVYDPEYYLVRTLVKESKRNRGKHQETWDGLDDRGQAVPDEAYFFTIEAEDKKGNIAIYDPTTFSGGDEFDITSAKIEPRANTIIYKLQNPSRILIRIGISGGPLLNNLVNWRPRISGEITEYWNGKDEDNLFDLFKDPNCKTVITGFKLCENSIITIGNSNYDFYNYLEDNGNRSKKVSRPAKIRKDVNISRNYLRPRILDKPIDTKITFPELEDYTADVIVLNTDKLLVRIDMEEKDKVVFQEQPFEISFFLDGKYYAEEEMGYVPYNWIWNLKETETGEHLLSVNVSSFKDQIGVKSYKVKILRK